MSYACRSCGRLFTLSFHTRGEHGPAAQLRRAHSESQYRLSSLSDRTIPTVATRPASSNVDGQDDHGGQDAADSEPESSDSEEQDSEAFFEDYESSTWNINHEVLPTPPFTGYRYQFVSSKLAGAGQR